MCRPQSGRAAFVAAAAAVLLVGCSCPRSPSQGIPGIARVDKVQRTPLRDTRVVQKSGRAAFVAAAAVDVMGAVDVGARQSRAYGHIRPAVIVQPVGADRSEPKRLAQSTDLPEFLSSSTSWTRFGHDLLGHDGWARIARRRCHMPPLASSYPRRPSNAVCVMTRFPRASGVAKLAPVLSPICWYYPGSAGAGADAGAGAGAGAALAPALPQALALRLRTSKMEPTAPLLERPVAIHPG